MWKTRARTPTQQLLETLAWFSLFTYPPTSFEVWRFCFGEIEFSTVERELGELVASGAVSARDGRYALSGNEGFFEERELRYRSALQKLRRARKAVQWLSRCKDVRAVFACNTLGFMHTREESDIDIFVIARHGALWRVRFLAVAPYIVLRQRPKASDEQDALCFSFFLSDKDMDLRRFALLDEDPYLAFWIGTLLPLYDPEDLYSSLRVSSGIEEVFPQFGKYTGLVGVSAAEHQHSGLRFSVPAGFENILGTIQRKKFPAMIRERIGKGTDVVVAEDALKFHTNDRRAQYREGFLDMLGKLGM